MAPTRPKASNVTITMSTIRIRRGNATQSAPRQLQDSGRRPSPRTVAAPRNVGHGENREHESQECEPLSYECVLVQATGTRDDSCAEARRAHQAKTAMTPTSTIPPQRSAAQRAPDRFSRSGHTGDIDAFALSRLTDG